jgi:hypothetical protein
LGIGDWGLGIGDWGLGPIPNPQSPFENYNYHYKIILPNKIKILFRNNKKIFISFILIKY